MDRSFFGVSCVDINEEQNPRLRQAMCNQVDRCLFNFETQMCVPPRRSRTAARTVQSVDDNAGMGRTYVRSGARPDTVNLRTLRKTLKSDPGQARAVLTALSDYTQDEDAEPMVAKIVRWAIVPLLPLVTYVAVQQNVDVFVNMVVRVLKYLHKVLNEQAFKHLWLNYIFPAISYTMDSKLTKIYEQAEELPLELVPLKKTDSFF